MAAPFSTGRARARNRRRAALQAITRIFSMISRPAWPQYGRMVGMKILRAAAELSRRHHFHRLGDLLRPDRRRRCGLRTSFQIAPWMVGKLGEWQNGNGS